MKVVKAIVRMAMTVSTGILIAMSLEGVALHFIYGVKFSFEWYHPLSILVCGVLCAIVSAVWVDEKKLTRGQIIGKMILHFLLIYAIVMLSGYLFGWYDGPTGFCVISLACILVYNFVWVVSTWLGHKEETEINAALSSIRDEE